MVKLELQVLIEGENVTGVQPVDFADHQFWLQIKCTMCHEVHPKNVAIIPSEEDQLPNTKEGNTANLVFKCSFCGKASYAKVENKGSDAVSSEDIDNHSYKTWLALECRNMEPIGFEARDDSYVCSSALSDTKFSEVTLDGEWSDYDEKSGESVSIEGIKFRFVKVK